MRPLWRVAGVARRAIERLAFTVAHPRVPVIRPERVGSYYSQGGQDLFLSALLHDYLRSGDEYWLLDVGCSDPQRFSNTLFFEENFSCRTLAVDPQEELAEQWSRRRPRAVFVNAAVAAKPGLATLHVPVGPGSDSMLASTVEYGSRRAAQWVSATRERQVATLPLSDILTRHGVSEVLFASVDVEGAELEVLASLDYASVRVHCLLVENNSYGWYGTEEVRRFLAGHRFRFIARIGHLDDIFVHESALGRVPARFR